MQNPPSSAPLVTVIIASYNASKYIVEAVDSILQQSYPNIEIVLINDGSTDDTEEVLAPYMSRIRYTYQENQGIPQTFNRGLEMAQGKYICILGADDYWITADKVEKQVAILEANPSLDYVHSGYYRVNPVGKVLNSVEMWTLIPNLTMLDWFVWKPILLQPLMLTQKCIQAVGGFKTNYPVGEDAELLFHIIARGYKGAWLKEITTAYRIHPTSISHRKQIEQLDLNLQALHYYLNFESVPQHIKNQSLFILFFAYIHIINNLMEKEDLTVAIRYSKIAPTYFWHTRSFGSYDLATYLMDHINYIEEHVQKYDDFIALMKQSFEIPDTLQLSSRLSIDTDELLHWWLCIWWRYYHAMTPENKETDLYRHPSIFKSYAITFYQNKAVDEIIHLARISIFVSSLPLNEQTLPIIELFCREMIEFRVISSPDSHHLIDLYFAVATRALYYNQWRYTLLAMRLALDHTEIKNLLRWGRFSLSWVGYIVRKLVN
jgi:glycosyltransferase involved in cell wall biosynthesis